MATILPTAETTFFDGNGDPLAGGLVYFYVPNTTTPKDTWTNQAQTTLNTNPVVLDGAGRATIFGSGAYRQIVKDSNNNIIWDRTTSEPTAGNTSYGGTSAGTANAQTLSGGTFDGSDGSTIVFVAGLTNSGPTTLSVGGGSPIAILKNSQSGPLPLVARDIVAGNIYSVSYSSTLASFLLLNSPASTSYNEKSANYTAVLTDNQTTTRFTAAVTLSLTAAATLGANWRFKAIAYNGDVLISPAGGAINGLASLVLKSGQTGDIFCNGTAFFVVIYGDTLSGPQLQGYSFGLGLSTSGVDPANDVDIASGAAASDVPPFNLMQLGSALTKRLDASWSVGNNQGGLDTGAVSAAATYYIWLIQRSDTLVVDVLFSLSSTVPTMPANYDRKRLIGSLVRTGSVNAKPAGAGQSPIFVSSQQSFVAGSSLVLAHGLAAQPTEVFLEFVCKLAWNGYSVGDRVLMPSSTAAHDENYTNTGYSVSVDATNIRVHFASNGVPLVTKGGGATPFFGGSQFDLIVRGRG